MARRRRAAWALLAGMLWCGLRGVEGRLDAGVVEPLRAFAAALRWTGWTPALGSPQSFDCPVAAQPSGPPYLACAAAALPGGPTPITGLLLQGPTVSGNLTAALEALVNAAPNGLPDVIALQILQAGAIAELPPLALLLQAFPTLISLEIAVQASTRTPPSQRLLADIARGGLRSDFAGLELNNVGLSGGIPNLTASLAKVQRLVLANNPDLGGEFPDWLPTLSKLRVVDLSNCGLSGRIPSSWRTNELSYLDASRNSLIGPFPTGLPVTLREINLEMNGYNEPFPEASLAGLSNLVRVDLSDNTFQGPFNIFSSLPNLVVFRVARNNLTGPLEENAAYSRSLKVLVMDSNPIGLKFMSLSANSLSGPIPAVFPELEALREMYLGQNKLNGTLPRLKRPLTELVNLNISSNALTGGIPASWYQYLPSLKLLDLAVNKLSGELPLQFLSLSSNMTLSELYLKDNWFAGPVNFPSKLKTGLTRLLLGGNPLPCGSTKAFNYSSVASDTDYEFSYSDKKGGSNACCLNASLGKVDAPFESVFPATDQDVYSIESPDACSKKLGYFGRVSARCAGFREWIVVSDCEKCLCPPERGICNNGPEGDGTCTACMGFFTGPYCNISVIPEPPTIIQLEPESGGSSRLRLMLEQPLILRMLFKKAVRLSNDTAWLAIRNPSGSYVNVTAASAPEAFSVERTADGKTWTSISNAKNESAWVLSVKVPGNSISRPSSIYSVLLGSGSVVSVETGLPHPGIGLSTTDRSWVLLSDTSSALDLRYTIRSRFPARVTLSLDLSQIGDGVLPQRVEAAAVLDPAAAGADLRLRLETRLRMEISTVLAIPAASTAEKFAFSKGSGPSSVVEISFRILPVSSAATSSRGPTSTRSMEMGPTTEDGRSPAGLATILEELNKANTTALSSGQVTRAIVTGSLRWGSDSPADANLQSTEGRAITIGSLATVFALCLLALILHLSRRVPESRYGDVCSLFLSIGSLIADFAFVILFLGRLSDYGFFQAYVAGLALISTAAAVNLAVGLSLFLSNLSRSAHAPRSAKDLALWVESNMFIVAPVLFCNIASAENSLVLSSRFMGLSWFSAPLTSEAERRMRLAGTIRLLLSSAPMLVLNIFVLLSVGELSALNFASIVLSLASIVLGMVRKITQWVLFAFQAKQPAETPLEMTAGGSDKRSSGSQKSHTSEHIETHITITTKRVSAVNPSSYQGPSTLTSSPNQSVLVR